MIKVLNRLKTQGTYLKIKTIYNKPVSNINLNGKKLKELNPETSQCCPFSQDLFKIVAEILARATRRLKEIKGIQMQSKESKIVYLSDLKNSTRKFLHLTNPFSKVAGRKVTLKNW